MSVRVRLGRRLRDSLVNSILGDFIRRAVRSHPYVYGPQDRVQLGEGVVLNDALLNTSSGTISFGRYAFCGHGVSILTGTHEVDGVHGRERQDAAPTEGRNVVIGEGAWIASNATVLGPATIGDHAVVAAGAIVSGEVPPHSIVGGIPAKVLRYQRPSPNTSPPHTP
ncbi:MAG: acyltransferase [Solirubrobacteraceae bacterium]